MLNCQLPMHNCQLPMLNCQCQLPTKLAVAKTPILIGSANCQQNWQLLKRQLRLAVETANRNWRQFWSQPRLELEVRTSGETAPDSRNKTPRRFAEVESSRTRFDVLGLGLEGQVLGLVLQASNPRKLPCPRLEDSSIFLIVKIL